MRRSSRRIGQVAAVSSGASLCRSRFVRTSSFSCSTRSRWMSLEVGGAGCACTMAGVSNRIGSRNQENALGRVESSPETQLSGALPGETLATPCCGNASNSLELQSHSNIDTIPRLHSATSYHTSRVCERLRPIERFLAPVAVSARTMKATTNHAERHAQWSNYHHPCDARSGRARGEASGSLPLSATAWPGLSASATHTGDDAVASAHWARPASVIAVRARPRAD